MAKYGEGLEKADEGAADIKLASLFDGMLGTTPAPLKTAVADAEDAGIVANAKEFAQFLFDVALKTVPRTELTEEQAAYILFNTAEGDERDPAMSPPYYKQMNARCRALDLEGLKHFAKFMYGLMYALHRVPAAKTSVVFRGVKKDLRSVYREGQLTVWWSFSSCTTNIKVLESDLFCGASGHRTIFAIHLNHQRVRPLEQVSLHPEEEEAVLLPGTTLLTRSVATLAAQQYIIQMDEVEPQDKDLLRIWQSFGDDPLDDESKKLEQEVQMLQRRLAQAGNPHKIPLSFIDPFTFSIIRDPVKASDNCIYDRHGITTWIHERLDRGEEVVSPLTKEPMSTMLTQDDDCLELKRDIDRIIKDLGPMAHDAEDKDFQTIASIHSLSHTFRVLDELDDVLQQTLENWRPPQLVVLGKEKAGKSSLMERLCMMPLFPQDRAICTRMAIRVIVRPCKDPVPPKIEVWDTDKNQQLGKSCTMTACMADSDVKAKMEQVIKDAGEDWGICTNKELRITITSTTLPPLNFIDLPGIVALPDEVKERTELLAKRYVAEHKDCSMYLVAIEATETPRNSLALKMLKDLKLLDRAVGVFTKCDRVEEEDIPDLKSRLANEDTEKNIVLQPHGYVGTMNKRPGGGPIKVFLGSSNLARLHEQAKRENRWFQENGFEEELASSQVSTAALIGKITQMFDNYVSRSWIPNTISLLYLERFKCQNELDHLGLPVADGKLDGPDLTALAEAAVSHVLQLVTPVLDRAVANFGNNFLDSLQSVIMKHIPEKHVASPLYFKNALTGIFEKVMTNCYALEARVAGDYCDCIHHALQENRMPFCLNRFPRLVQRLARRFTSQPPRLATGTMAQVEELFSKAIKDADEHFCSMKYDLKASTPKAELTFKKQLISDRVIYICFGNLVLLDIEKETRAVVEEVFDLRKDQPEGQEQEVCFRDKRIGLLDRKTMIEKVIRTLAELIEKMPIDIPIENIAATYVPGGAVTVARVAVQRVRVEMQRVLEAKDVLGSGLTTLDELKAVLSSWNISGINAEKMLKCARVNSEGLVDFSSFLDWLLSSSDEDVEHGDSVMTLTSKLELCMRASESRFTPKDSISGVIFNKVPFDTHAGHECWNLEQGAVINTGSQASVGPCYTHAVWVYWRNHNGWMYLLHHTHGGAGVYQKKLGIYGGRLGWVATSYSIENDLSSWQLVIVTQEGATSTFFTAAEGETVIKKRGQVNSKIMDGVTESNKSKVVALGTYAHELGTTGYNPGKVAAAYQWDRILTEEEMNLLLSLGVDTDIRGIHEAHGAPKLAHDLISIQIMGEETVATCVPGGAVTVARVAVQRARVEMQRVLEAKDVLGSGLTTLDELKFVLSRWNISGINAEKMLKCARVNSEGLVDFTSFLDWLLSSSNEEVEHGDSVMTSTSKLELCMRASESRSTPKDSISGMLFNKVPFDTHAGHECWNLEQGAVINTGSQTSVGPCYTHAVWVYWRNHNCWMYLLHHTHGGAGVYQKKLGIYSGRLGWFATSYSIQNDLSSWQLVIVTQEGATSTFFTAAEGEAAIKKRGQVNSKIMDGVTESNKSKVVALGTYALELGTTGYNPGKVAAAYQWDRILTEEDMNLLLSLGVDADIGGMHEAHRAPKLAHDLISIEILGEKTVATCVPGGAVTVARVAMQRAFEEKDVSGSGLTTLDELKVVLSSWNISGSNAEKILQCAGVNSERSVHFSSFLDWLLVSSKEGGGHMMFELELCMRASESRATPKDSVSGMTFNTVPLHTYAGHESWNLAQGHSINIASQISVGPCYTHAVWVFWKNYNGWMYLLHHTHGGAGVYQKKLGIYGGHLGWFATSYSIENDLSSWQLVIVTQEGTTSTFFTAAESETAVKNRGQVNSLITNGVTESNKSKVVALGTYALEPAAGASYNPGNVAAAYQWGRILTEEDMNLLLSLGVDADISGKHGAQKGAQKLACDLISEKFA